MSKAQNSVEGVILSILRKKVSRPNSKLIQNVQTYFFENLNLFFVL